MNEQAPSISGLLLIDKPPGKTSMHVCANIRARLRKGGAPMRIKVGHAGTLDPLATGLLIVMVGAFARRCDEFMAGEKEYETVVDLSHFSTTDDAEGEKTFVYPASPPTHAMIRAACDALTGEIMQRPPAYSAVHVGGRRAYALAREGKSVELAARPVTVREIRVISYAWPSLSLTITCGKGVYIRSLARSLGETLGTGGMLSALRRTRIGTHNVRDALTLYQLPPTMTQAHMWETGA